MKKRTAQKVNRGSTLRTVLLVLLVLELCAAVLLSTRLIVSGGEKSNRISLTEGSAGSVVTVKRRAPHKFRAPSTARAQAAPLNRAAESRSDYRVTDADKVWETETDVEIFRLRYDNNGDLVYTVESGNGDKLLAPGTGNSYAFTLANTGRMPLDYTLTFECWQEGGGYVLPIQARLTDSDGNYLLGEESLWTPVLELGDAEDGRALRAGESMTYTFEWMWPFERTREDGLGLYDAQDTMLGNAAMNGDISLHIRILTVAEVDEELAAEIIDDNPIALTNYDGTAWALVNLICTVLTGVVGIYELLVFLRGRKEDEKARKSGVYDKDAYQRLRKRRKRKAWDLVPLVGAIVTFLLTEDMRLPMTWVDRWTPLMAVILAISLTVALLTRLKKLREEVKEIEEAVAVR